MIPVGEKLIVKPLSAERKSKGGIIIPEETARKEDLAMVKAEVIAVGPLAFDLEKDHEIKFGDNIKNIPKAGDTIIIAKYSGLNVKQDGEMYRFIKDEDVIAILEEGDV